MEPWKERLIDERNELSERLGKLNVFLANEEASFLVMCDFVADYIRNGRR